MTRDDHPEVGNAIGKKTQVMKADDRL